MTYVEIKQNEMKRAQAYIDMINATDDPRIKYKNHRPITDLKQMFRTSVELYGDHTAFMQRFVKGEPFRKITYKEAYADVNAYGTALIRLGLKDKNIAIIGENCYQWASTYLAVTGGVGVVVPLDKELGALELKGLVKEAECSAVVFSKKYEDIFKEAKEQNDRIEVLINFNSESANDGVLSWSEVIEDGRKLVADGDRSYLDAQIIADEMGVILFTSGTTGIAKGVMLSQTNICFDLMGAPNILETLDTDIFFSVLPIHHTYECTCGFLMAMYKGSCVAYCEGLKYIQKNLQEIRPTFFLGVPLIFESLYKTIWKNIRKQGKEEQVKKVMKLNRITSKAGININKKFLKDIINVFGGRLDMIICGGAAIDPAILEFFNELGIMAVQGYGLTECSPIVALNSDQSKYNRLDSAGILIPGVECEIRDKDEEGIGEICFKGGNIMMGYYNMPEETAKVLKDGWFLSGDLGYLDKNNNIYITGRKKNVIITRNGKNVFPEELEYLLSRVEAVSESMVFAESDEDGQDDAIVAVIRPDMDVLKGAIGEDADDDSKVYEYIKASVDKINDGLPTFKWIKKIVIRHDEFEKTTGHKIKRFVERNKQ